MTVLGTCDWCDQNPIVIVNEAKACSDHLDNAMKNGTTGMRAAARAAGINLDPTAHARTSDPATSHVAAHALSDKATMMRYLLRAYRSGRGLTADEATAAAGYTAYHGAWKRVSDLKRNGWIEPTGTTRPGASGRPQQVCVITDEGREQLT